MKGIHAIQSVPGLAPGLRRPIAFGERQWLRNIRLPALDPAIILPALVLGTIGVAALVPGWIAPFLPTDMDDAAILGAPGTHHWMGTDHIGRDVLSLVIYGARHSLVAAVSAVLLGLSGAGLMGITAGYVGGITDMVIMRSIDLWLSIPYLLLAIILATALGPSFGHTIIAISLALMPSFARIIRSQVLAIRSQPFIEASRSIGTPHWSILLKHVLPHALGPILVLVTVGAVDALLIGAMLSFIGLGIIDDTPDWGFLLNQGKSYVTVAWWFATFPGLAITALILSINMLGEALRHRLDPRSRLR